MKTKRKLGFVGFGSFGKFIIPHLSPYFDITVYDINEQKELATKLGCQWGTLKETVQQEMVALAVPVQYLEELLIKTKDWFLPKTLVFDLSSVKVKPVDLMIKYLPKEVDIVGTHPLFGPQSGKNGIAGLNIVICPVRTKKNHNLTRFFERELKLVVLDRTPVVHDKQMAYVQALTHFVGRAVNAMDIPDVEQKTPAYQYLLDIKRNLGQDSFDLFLTIENENPYAEEIRNLFIEELVNLNKLLIDKKGK